MEKTKVKKKKKEYTLQIASTKAELRKGLMGVTNLAENEGMLFDFGEEGNHEMWMYNTPIALDQIFINSDQVVTKVVTREPNDETLVGEPDTMYVVELNANSGVKEGDELEFLDDTKEYTDIDVDVVHFDDEGLCFSYGKSPFLCVVDNVTAEYEVIGNIHDNPELLEVKL